MKLDPEMDRLRDFPPIGMDDPIAARALGADAVLPWFVEPTVPDGVSFEDRTVVSPDVAEEIPIRIYRPTSDLPLPAMVYCHGGAFAFGNLDSEHGRCLDLAATGVLVVSVDYRLAPEHVFPAGLDDCYAALQWLHGSASELGVDCNRLAVAGASAGGALAAAVALMARDREGPPLAFQLLVYPVLDDRMSSSSMQQFADAAVFTPADAALMWRHYLGPGSDVPPSYAAPARAASLAELPPAYILAAALDPLRDEAVAYALRLQEAGVAVELHLVPRAPHGFDLLAPEAKASERARRTLLDALRQALL